MEGDKSKYNEILTKILEKVPFGVCVSFNLVYSCMHTGSKGSPRGETGSSNRMGSTLYLSVIVVGVRVTRISTDKLCGTDVVRGWVASVPYLFILYCEVSYSLQGPARECRSLLFNCIESLTPRGAPLSGASRGFCVFKEICPSMSGVGGDGCPQELSTLWRSMSNVENYTDSGWGTVWSGV